MGMTSAELPPISAIAVEGYKSVRERQEIEIRPLTLLAGANSSGKSSMMQPLLLLKQTLEAPYDPGPLLLDGPNMRATTTDQLLACAPGGPSAERFSVALRRGSVGVELAFGKRKDAGFDILSMAFADGMGHDFEVSPDATDAQIRKILDCSAWHVRRAVHKEKVIEAEWAIHRDKCFLRFLLREAVAYPNWGVLETPVGPSAGSLFGPAIENVTHLPGLRGSPERTYGRTGIGPKYPGTFDHYVASVIYHWGAKDRGRLTELGALLEELGLTWKVTAKPVDDTQVELRVGRLPHARRGGARDLVNIADVGFGVSQSLPVLVALLAARPGQLVYLEQPEIHLHPRAQRKMAGILAAAARRGVIVVAETHSSLVVREIQTLVARGELDSKLVKLHWFTRSETDGTTAITSRDLDENGAYGDWPEDFDDVALASERAYLDAVEARGEGVGG